jgi:ubiquinone/menaquinone biosynthesis C-methylase UbiE
MSHSHVKHLNCPYCSQTFSCEDDGHLEGYGILHCGCSEFPIISDIPVLQKDLIGPYGLSAKRLCKKIRAGQYQDVLTSMLAPNLKNLQISFALIRKIPILKDMNCVKRIFQKASLKSWHDEAASFFINHKDNLTVSKVIDFYFERDTSVTEDARDYFLYRFGQPRHLVSLSLNMLISDKEKPILDLACGMGHITRGLMNTHPDQDVIGLDNNFFNLYLAKHFIAPKADYLFCGADLSLPFANDCFAGVLCSNSFHFFHYKSQCSRELKRIISDNGLIIITAVRHDLIKYQGQRTLLISGYQSLFEDIPHRLASDSSILDRYLQKKGPLLKQQMELETLEKEPFISIIASHNKDVYVDHGTFKSWPHGTGQLSINPLFDCNESNGSKTILVRRFLSEFYKRENVESDNYLPEKITVSSQLLEQLPLIPENTEIEDLISKCVLLDVPDRYM